MSNRPLLLGLFKQVLHAEEEDDFDDILDSFMKDEVVLQHPKFIKYVESMCEEKESWALSYRRQVLIRGNQTNNYCEAQFLVLKDDVLGRQKEVNVVGLVDKLTGELDDHYKNKLLQAASGKSDGIYPRRFRAGATKKTPKIGYNIPTKEEQDYVVNNLQDLENNTFLVPSMS